MKRADRVLDVIRIQEREIDRLKEIVRRYQLAVQTHREQCEKGVLHVETV